MVFVYMKATKSSLAATIAIVRSAQDVFIIDSCPSHLVVAGTFLLVGGATVVGGMSS